MALVLAVASAGAAPGLAVAQVSPGPLAEAHRALDGPLSCFQCHARVGSRAGMDARCLTCHKEIAGRRAARRGVHAAVADRACAGCHPDHGGRDFHLIAWDGGSPEAFDHRRAGYALQGKHASLECGACHKPALQRSPLAPAIQIQDRSRSFLGLRTECASCHADIHKGQLGADCARCHDPRDWSRAAGFDHARSRYPLVGAHATVPCAKCHEPAHLDLARDPKGRRLPRYRPLPFAECGACHRDPHAGRFGEACASCHRVTHAFAEVAPEGFDHDRTRYPLRGKHRGLACARCHDPRSATGKRPPFQRCASCHRDAHAGRATLAGAPADCAACHDVRGFEHSTYTVTQHQGTSYPLMGAHARAACVDCHRRGDAAAAALLGPARVAMRPEYDTCVACHRNPHEGERDAGAPARGGRPRSAGGDRAATPAAGRPRDASGVALAAECVTCHGVERFRPSSVDAAAHAAFAYPLTGAHRAVPCQACHAELRRPPSPSTLRAASGPSLRFEERGRRCADCHADPHAGQFAKRPGGDACESCHGGDAFRPATKFDHRRDADFALEGAHARAACAACHTTGRGPDGKPFVVYRPVPRRCEQCHEAGVPRSGGGSRGSLLLTSREVLLASNRR